MNRAGLFIALAVAGITGLVLGLYPQLDLAISRWFFAADRHMFVGFDPWMMRLRDIATWIVTALAVPAAVAPIAKLLRPRLPFAIPPRAIILLVATLVLAPGLLANVVLKDYWGRPRPIDVIEFGGTDHFVPWWDPRGECPKNCSFIAGEGAGAFWTLAPAALAPPAIRPLAYVAAIAFGAATGTVRIAAGGHFFSDVVFSGVFTFLIIWIAHGWLYRWQATRICDGAIERHYECTANRFRIALAAITGRFSSKAPPLDERDTGRS